MLAYVINQHGEPLMPCSPRKARLLLKSNKAKVINRTPFTIQLRHGSSGYKQPITLGVDAGSKMVGLSATTEKKVLFEAETELRTDIVELLAERASLRKGRRNRNLRYRPARFKNRKKQKGWLAPSIQHKIGSHLRLVDLVHKILPVKKIIAEVAAFDIQKIKNPEIAGAEYQQGPQMDFWNVREYVLWRDGHKCRGKEGCKGKILNVHHIESRKTGGNAPGNLITLCEKCHDSYHQGKLKLDHKRGKSYKHQTFMGIMRWAFYNRLKEQYPDVSLTYGYLTKNTRIENALDKSHRVDARCISGNPLAAESNWYKYKFVRGQNRCLHKANPKKGVRKANKAPRYVHGYQLFDKVDYQGRECFVFGRRTSGYFDLRTLDGEIIHRSASVKKLKLIEKASTLLCERREGAFLSRLKSRVSSAV